jgi:type III pantothenate kinase
MILSIDVGNTGIAFGFYKEKSIVHHSKVSSRPYKSKDEFVMLLNNICNHKKIQPADVEGCAISSVVPPLTEQIRQGVEEFFSCKPLLITPGIKTGLNIRIDVHTQLGSDIVANNVAAAAILPKPFAVVDLGTATTVSAVNKAGELIGVIIAPGTRIAVDALSAAAAELPYISLTRPKVLLGKNTQDSMVSGCIYGTACMIDGFIEKLKVELETDKLNVIACGGLADIIIPYCRESISVNRYLTLDGLVHLYYMNAGRSRSYI